MQPLLDPALMQVVQLLVYAVVGFLGILGTYFTVKTNLLTKKVNNLAKTIEEAKDDLAANTNKTEQIRDIVNGRTAGLMAEIEALKKQVVSLGGKPAEPNHDH